MNLSNFMQKMLPSSLSRLTPNSRLLAMGIFTKASQTWMKIPLTFSQTFVLLYTLGGDLKLSETFRQQHKPTWLLLRAVARQ